MPERPGLDDDEALKNLIALWRDGADDLQSRVDQIRRELRAELGRDRVAVARLRAAARRLEDLEAVATAIADDLVDGTQAWIFGDGPIEEGGLGRIYAAGAETVGVGFSFTQPHRAALEVLARDLFDDVLTMGDQIDGDAKRWVRQVGRKYTNITLTGGLTPRGAARRFERGLVSEFLGRRGLGAIVYADGSRHSFGEYAEMLLRTKTSVVHNRGALNQGRLAGIKYYELLDGALCGLTSHNDTQLANGLIVDWQTAMDYPLSHPNCRRAVNARPDLNDSNVGEAVSVQSDEAREDQAAFERALALDARSRSRASRRSRASSTRRRRGRRSRTPRRRSRR